MALGAVISGDDEAAALLVGIGTRAVLRVPPVVRTYGLLYQTRVRAAASGRPGPRAITGDYRRSISVRFVIAEGQARAIVGTDRPQGRRLELGFVGVDALGRHYDQPPYPHFEPPLQQTLDEMAEAIAMAVAG